MQDCSKCPFPQLRMSMCAETTLNIIRGTKLSLKDSLANGDALLKKTCPRERFVSELQAKNLVV